MGFADKIKETTTQFSDAEPQAVSGRPCPVVEPEVEPEPQPEPEKVKKVIPPKSEEKQKKKSWIEIMLVDMEGKPMPGVRYRITPPGGEPQEGTLNEFGQAGYYEIEPGTCKVTFPDLDADAWE